MKVLLYSLMVLNLLCAKSIADVIKFNIYDEGYPPYMIEQENGDYSGIMVDVLRQIAQLEGHQIQVIKLPRKRMVKMTLMGEADVSVTAIEWIKDPQKLTFTDPVIESRDVLFSLRKKPLLFNELKDIYGSTLAAHFGYVYPFLDEAFAEGNIFRRNALSFESMLKMTLLNQTDAAVINRDVGLWVIKNSPEFRRKFLSTDKAVNVFQLRLMLNKKWQPFVTRFNYHLAMLRKSGELRKIVERYR